MLWVVDVKTAATTTTTMPISMLNPAPFSVFPNQFLQAYTNFRQTFTEPQINMGIAHFSTTDLIGICVKFDRTQDLFGKLIDFFGFNQVVRNFKIQTKIYAFLYSENRFKAIIANLNVTPIAGWWKDFETDLRLDFSSFLSFYFSFPLGIFSFSNFSNFYFCFFFANILPFEWNCQLLLFQFLCPFSFFLLFSMHLNKKLLLIYSFVIQYSK